MNSRMYALAICSVILSALAQMAFKFGMSRGNVQHAVTVTLSEQPLRSLLIVLLNPGVFGGLTLYAGSAVLWLFVLAKLDLSVAYPFVGLGFVLTMLAGFFFFNEPATLSRIAGTLLICGGVCLVARS